MKGQRLQVVDKFIYLGSTLSRACTLMMRSMLGLPKLVQHLAGYVKVFGTEVESDLHKAESIQIGGAANTIICMRNLGQFTNGMPKH